MSVFICWSGGRSKAIADALKPLLESVLPELTGRTPAAAHVFLSEDIEKGAEWFQAVREKLNSSSAGIVVLTYENRQNAWIHFEAGALARKLSAEPASENQQRLFPLLHGISGAELAGPLAAYQATNTTRADMGRLVTALAAVLGSKPAAPTADRFVIADDAWERFEATLHDAAVPLATLIADLQFSFQRKTFDEPLHACADQKWLARYEGVTVTLARLKQHQALVDAACAPHEQGLFRMLLSDLDRYAMGIQALLITPVKFPLGSQGTLLMDSGTQASCEDRRLAIKSVSSRLLHPLDAPLTTAAVRFMAAETDEERKAIVHLIEGRIRWQRELAYEAIAKNEAPRSSADYEAINRLMQDSARNVKPKGEEDSSKRNEEDRSEKREPLLQCRTPQRLMTFRASSWDLDRIFYYRVVYYFETAAFRWPQKAEMSDRTLASPTSPDMPMPLAHDLFCASRDVEMEAEKFRARTKGGSLMPLIYALEAFRGLHPRATGAGDARVEASITSALATVREQLSDVLLTEAGRPIATLLASL